MKKLILSALAVTFLMGLNGLMAQPTMKSFPSAPSGEHSIGSNRLQWQNKFSEAVALSQSTSKPIAILFTGTSWCPACQKLEREVMSQPEFAQLVGQKFVFLKAEFPEYSENSLMKSPFKPLLDRYGINSFPTIVVINANGQELYRVNYRQGGPQAYAQEMLQKLGNR